MREGGSKVPGAAVQVQPGPCAIGLAGLATLSGRRCRSRSGGSKLLGSSLFRRRLLRRGLARCRFLGHLSFSGGLHFLRCALDDSCALLGHGFALGRRASGLLCCSGLLGRGSLLGRRTASGLAYREHLTVRGCCNPSRRASEASPRRASLWVAISHDTSARALCGSGLLSHDGLLGRQNSLRHRGRQMVNCHTQAIHQCPDLCNGCLRFLLGQARRLLLQSGNLTLDFSDCEFGHIEKGLGWEEA